MHIYQRHFQTIEATESTYVSANTRSFHLVVAVPVQFCEGWQSVTGGTRESSRKREEQSGARERQSAKRGEGKERDGTREIDG